VASTTNQAFFWRRCRGLKKKKLPRQPRAIINFFGAVAEEKEDFYKGSLSLPIFYFVIVLLTFFTLFLLASFYQKYKKNSFYSWYFIIPTFSSLCCSLNTFWKTYQ
jgi:predicted permease